MGYVRHILLGTFLVLPVMAIAHPVSFKQGTMVMAGFEPQRYDVQGNFTFSRHLAVGLSYMRVEQNGSAATFAFPQLNWLVKRWNQKESQGNIYLYGGLGYRNYQGQDRIGGFVGGEADYETRRFYTSIQEQSLLSPDGLRLHRGTIKIGGAPYLAPFDKPSLWLIGKGEYASYMEGDKKVTFSPALRLLYKKWFLEAGSSFNGMWYANIMTVF